MKEILNIINTAQFQILRGIGWTGYRLRNIYFNLRIINIIECSSPHRKHQLVRHTHFRFRYYAIKTIGLCDIFTAFQLGVDQSPPSISRWIENEKINRAKYLKHLMKYIEPSISIFRRRDLPRRAHSLCLCKQQQWWRQGGSSLIYYVWFFAILDVLEVVKTV